MTLVRWNPWQGLFDVQRDMDVLMRRLTGEGPASGNGPFKGWVPAVDIFHRDKDLVVRAELPGIDPERDVEIIVQDGVLTIRGERRQEERTNDGGTFRYESAYGRFERSVMLPQGVKEDDIQASYENGIFEVVVPGAAQLTEGRRIPIQVGEGRRKSLTTRGHKS
jgi:HSP20 family protein